jgi:ribonuclease HI
VLFGLLARNNARFYNKTTHWKSVVNWIQANVSMAGNRSKSCAYSSISYFSILKKYNVIIHPPKAPGIKEVIWHSPISLWVKCNTDETSNNTSSCGGIFRNSNSEFICGFDDNIGHKSAFIAEICGVMRAIEIAASHNWPNLWLETDSSLVVPAFKSHELVSWSLSNRWFNCTRIIRNMNFFVSHIYRKGNCCANGLANVGLTIDSFTFDMNFHRSLEIVSMIIELVYLISDFG